MSIYIFEQRKIGWTKLRCCCCFGGRRWGLEPFSFFLRNFLICQRVIIRLRCRVAGHASGLSRIWRRHPCSSSNGRWEYCITSSAPLFTPLQPVARTSTVKKIKEGNPRLWVCYPSKDTRHFPFWLAVRTELFKKKIKERKCWYFLKDF